MIKFKQEFIRFNVSIMVHFRGQVKYSLSLFLVIICWFPGYSQVNKELDHYVYHYWLNKNVPSVSVGILSKGKIVYQDAVGFSDLENTTPANPKTIYRIASISKSITAVAIMQLFERGKIGLDDDVRKYIPYFPRKKWKFTIRQLLSHTAGIRNYRNNEFDSKDSYRSTRDAVNSIVNDPLEFEPGTKYQYTTLGYNLLAAVIENVTKIPFTDYLKKYIFTPSGMTFTFPEYHKDIIHNRAHGYEKNIYRKFENAPLSDLSLKFAGGGLISNTEDLLKFANCLMNGKLIKTSTLDIMTGPVTLKNGQVLGYSLGFSSGKDNMGRRYITHSGSGTGFVSNLLIYPDDYCAFVYLVNCKEKSYENPAFQLASIYFDKARINPKVLLSDRLMGSYYNSSIDSTLKYYYRIKKDSVEYFVFSPEEVYSFGNDLITIWQIPDAIKLFKLMVSEYPNYSKSYTGLADAYYKDNNKGMAVKNYRLSLKLDPHNSYASEMIKKLERL
jgi:CubicO group peptidase (beta-lactamase class C family)